MTAWLAATVTALFAAALAAAQAPSIRLVDGAFQVTGWTPGVEPREGGWGSIFRVYAGAGDVPPMSGVYAIEGGALTFRSRFPLSSGVRYRAVFAPPAATPVEAYFRGPEPQRGPATRVLQVFPSGDLLPENQLKLYIEFSAQMSRGEAWERIHLVDEWGKEAELPFLEIQQELWDRELQRMTVLFDPGRIKRGLIPNEEAGPPLVAGRRYALVIDKAWRDARGVELAQGHRKEFAVTPADRVPPDPKKWKLAIPDPDTDDTLSVDFGESMDAALLDRMLSVVGPLGLVAGHGMISKEESRWVFAPDAPWKAGAYRLVVNKALEDLAGNRIGRPFDVDTFERISKGITQATVSVPFRIR